MENNKNNITELVFILDRSGSMSGLESDTIGGFNSMLKEQRGLDGAAFVTTVLFDNEAQTIHDRLPIEKVPPMTEKDYTVRGCTALLDAIGSTVSHIDSIHKYARAEDVPEKTLFMITTDGMENASREYSAEKVKKLIEAKKECGWEFIFIGANIDAVTTAASFGIEEDHAVDYHADEKGTRVTFQAVCEAVSGLRRTKALSKSWCAPIKRDFEERG